VTAFVTGATGFVGAHVARALLAAGRRVRCLVRPTSEATLLAELPVERIAGDVTDAASVREAISGCDEVFHCAADYRLYARDPTEIYRTNVEGTRVVLAAAEALGVRRIVHTGSVATLAGRADGTPVDERAVATLDDVIGDYKRSKLLAEREVEAAWARGVPVVVVSPSTPVGDGDVKPTPTGKIIVDFLAGRFPAYVDTGLNVIDVRDVAAGHLLAAERGRPGERYILANANVTLKELLAMLAQIAGRAAPRLRLPHWVPLAIAHVEAPIARFLRRAPRVPLDGVRMSRKPMFFDGGKAVRELGLPQSPIEPALRRAVDWFISRGYAPRPNEKRPDAQEPSPDL
jgi:dihydroflavonol-4-reductase